MIPFLWLAALSPPGRAADDAATMPTVPEVKAPKVDLPTGDAVPEEPARPLPWRLVVFEDLPGSKDCDPASALQGACVEEVRFATVPRSDRSLTGLSAWRSLSAQSFRMWEGTAWRWAVADDPVANAVASGGTTELPSPADTWETWRRQKRAVAVPDADHWLPERSWIGPVGSGSGWFGSARYRVSQGRATPPVVVIGGRFARRLGVDGRAWEYEIMDADSADSAPFFEQFYPYANHEAAGMVAPLSEFKLPLRSDDTTPERAREDYAALLLETRSYAGLRDKATKAFEDYSRGLSVQITEFALENYTVNHMRVLTALAAMIVPPGDGAGSRGGRNLVAASLGETDSATETAARIDRSRYSLGRRFELNPAVVPLDVADRYVKLLVADRELRLLATTSPVEKERRAGARRLAEINQHLRESLGQDLRDPRELIQLEDVRLETMTVWAELSARPGVDPRLLVLEGQRLVLFDLLQAIPDPDVRAQWETWVLLDQGHRAAASTFDGTPGTLTTPGDAVKAATEQWVSVLTRHGFAPTPIEQGLGAVDPMSICTTLDGTAALAEPSFQAIHFDQLFAARDEANPDMDTLLWNARQQLPFLAVDDPEVSWPSLTRLVGLPDGMAVYRVRWQLWSGWHLLWTAEDVEGVGSRLALRTAAFCGDTVLAPPDLVPTLLRASLLDGPMRGTEPVPPLTKRPEKATPTTEEAEEAEKNRAWIRSLLLAPVRRLADDEGGLLLAVASVDEREGGSPLPDLVPRTPYRRDHRNAPGSDAVNTSMWGRYVAPDSDPATSPLISPAWRPGESVDSDSMHPRWHRVTVTDFALTGGVGLFPYRQSHVSCQSDPTSPGFTETCLGQDTDLRTEGFSVDAQGLTSFWIFDQPRMAAEAGVEVRLDVNHGGKTWFNEEPIEQNWMFRPAGGVLVGLRGAPMPGGLWGRGIPWGAERQDGTSRLRRAEYGLRSGFLLAPGYEGVEGTALAELWLGFSARRATSRLASFTPYNPRALYGFYVRGQYSLRLGADVTTPELLGQEMLILGLRGTWDLKAQLPKVKTGS